MRKPFQAWNIILIATLAILFFAVLYPLLYIFKASFISTDTGAFSLKSYATFFKYPYYLRCLGNSIFVSGLSTLLALALGIPFAFFLARYRIPGKNIIRTLGTLPLILPTFIGAEAWLLLLGRNGLFAKGLQGLGIEMPSIYGWKGIVLVFTLQFFPFVFLMVSSALNAIDRSLEEAATSLGSGKLRVFFTVTLPVVTPAILSGALVVFFLCIENFGVPVLIGEDFRVLSVQAYNEFISELGGNPAMAGALSMILLAITLGLTVFQKHWVERKNYTMTSLNPIEVKRLRPLPTFLIWLFCAGVVFVALFPFAVVMISSITKTHGPVMYFGQFSLENFIRAFTIAPRPIVNSFFLATTSTLIGIVFGIVVSYLLVRKKGAVSYLLDLLVMLPLAIAGTVQGIALAATYNKGIIVLTGTWMILVLAYFIRKAPYSIKTTSSLLQQIDPSIEEASISLGVPPVRSFIRVVLPIMLPGIIAGAIIMWVTTLAELSTTIVLYYGPWATMTVEIFQRIGSGDFGPASAYATILILSVLIPLFILNRVSGRDLASSL
ncbi:MAG: iron ABC transporter permease [Desulfobacteraceae bacterium]|nr:iron ABC transporter permease [Desulfobacteraceae bacterium]